MKKKIFMNNWNPFALFAEALQWTQSKWGKRKKKTFLLDLFVFRSFRSRWGGFGVLSFTENHKIHLHSAIKLMFYISHVCCMLVCWMNGSMVDVSISLRVELPSINEITKSIQWEIYNQTLEGKCEERLNGWQMRIFFFDSASVIVGFDFGLKIDFCFTLNNIICIIINNN